MFENLPPGILALIVLAVVTVGGLFYSLFQGTCRRFSIVWVARDSPLRFRIQCTASVAVIFWLWAIRNFITKGDPDLGMISFATVLIASGCTVRALRSSSISSNYYKYGMAVSTTLVTANYMLGFFIPSIPTTLQVYFGVGASYWAVIGLWLWQGFNRQMNSGVEATSLLSDSDVGQA
mmetsp:Transcript_14338/g.17289  ORF Transcript_14338/g.17289 Transcript_14338/m.17289 type:complete len:178 (+) Transcript_14338:80-613(+)